MTTRHLFLDFIVPILGGAALSIAVFIAWLMWWHHAH